VKIVANKSVNDAKTNRLLCDTA